ncbi:uncharacterized protein N7529_004458 [Penicillium soppii]|uniref:uncharacterized protein n=1 Tax=Penicillium soppii TaxID=69789 RepID=UPI002548CC21|nr:uncharacterized protein N7529_004458 [Penicillium soppii]KAJ5872105.1 hypothetical protein N7529_004458 [Penicillium soppii]
MYTLSLVKLLAFCYSLGATGHLIELKASTDLPHGASQPVDHAFASFSWPVHFFADYAGNKSCPNHFSQDIINLLHEKTGAYPHIRVGGTSADRAILNTSQSSSIVLSAESDNGIPLEVSLGPVFFEGFENFPSTPWTFQVNLANNKSNALENALAEARAAISHIRGNLYAFEIGNEPDLYPGDVRPLDYTVADYVKEWRSFADAISTEVLHGNRYGLNDWTLFQALTFVFNLNGFSTAQAFKDGIDMDGHVKSVSWHQYASGNQAWVRLQESFMNHTAVTGNLSQYIEDMTLIHSYNPNITFLLGETNSDYVNLNMSQIEGVFGSSLWLIDYLLYGMSVNITRFNLIQGTTFGYAGWTPVEHNGLAPQVRAPLYGQLVAAEAIGRHPIVQVKALDLERDDLSAYAIYESGVLARYLVVNLDGWNSTTKYARPSQKFALDVSHRVKSAEIKRLVGPGASADTGITWGGFSWNYTDGRLGRTGKDDTEVLKVLKGAVRLEVDSSEAVIVELQQE